MENINHVAVLVSVVAAQLLGFLWYSVAFGSTWSVGYRLEAGAMAKTDPKSLGITLVGAVFFSYGMAILFGLTGTGGVVPGLLGGVLVWIGLIGPRYMLHALFGKIAWSAIAIDIGYDLLVAAISGAIIGGFAA